MKVSTMVIDKTQKISLFFVLVFVAHVSGMNEKKIIPLTPEKQFKKFFPFMTHEQVAHNWQNLSDEKKEKVRNTFKKKSSGLLFDMLTILPTDVCKIILGKVLHGSRSTTDNFLKLPIKDGYERYLWADGFATSPSGQCFISNMNSKLSSVISIDFLLRNHDEVKKLNKYFLRLQDDSDSHATHEELRVFSVISQKNKKINVDNLFNRRIVYRYQEMCTLKNFWNIFVHDRRLHNIKIFYLLFLASFMMTCSSRFIELTACSSALTESDIAWNKEVPLFNEWVAQECAKLKTENPSFYQHIINQSGFFSSITEKRFGLRDLITEGYGLGDHCKMKAPFFLPLFCLNMWFCLTEIKEGIFNAIVSSAAISLFCGSVLMLPSVLLKLLSFLRFGDFFYGVFLGVFAGVTVGIWGAVSYKVVKEMKQIWKSSVELKDLAELLKRTDIVIE